jgi:mannan endo-1,4-beta-mannosidase
MSIRKTFLIFTILIYLTSSSQLKAMKPVKPVTPGASPEAVALLNLLYSVSGKYLLTGQHNFPDTRDNNSRFAKKYIGKTPAVFSSDWGFAEDGDKDSYLARPNIVDEAIRQHKLGSIITICWHAVPPTADEPVTFQPRPGSNPEVLASVQGQLPDNQFRDVLTPGTELYKKWCEQVDNIAFYLKELQKARVPILWRPYHEMNGDWFWWGGRLGRYSAKALYLQLFDRFVNHHKLNNLIWLWSVDRPNKPEMAFSNYYPGNQYLDVLSLDVYGNDFKQEYYDTLLKMSQGKPLVLGEFGNPPSLEILDKQPKWCFYVTWAGMVRNTMKRQYNILMKDPRFLNLDDPAYAGVIRSFREACDFPPIVIEDPVPDFSGKWIFNEEKSVLDRFGVSSVPYKITVVQEGNHISLKKIIVVEYADDQVIEENYTVDGREYPSMFMDFPAKTGISQSADKKSITFRTRATLNMGEQKSEVTINETWNLLDSNETLSIKQFSRTPWGTRDITLVFDRM